jgi:hypothetical protein
MEGKFCAPDRVSAVETGKDGLQAWMATISLQYADCVLDGDNEFQDITVRTGRHRTQRFGKRKRCLVRGENMKR